MCVRERMCVSLSQINVQERLMISGDTRGKMTERREETRGKRREQRAEERAEKRAKSREQREKGA